MTPEERVEQARLRLLAAQHQARAAELRMAASAIGASAAMRDLAAAVQDSIDQELAEHPDMAELDVQLDGFYAGGQ